MRSFSASSSGVGVRSARMPPSTRSCAEPTAAKSRGGTTKKSARRRSRRRLRTNCMPHGASFRVGGSGPLRESTGTRKRVLKSAPTTPTEPNTDICTRPGKPEAMSAAIPAMVVRAPSHMPGHKRVISASLPSSFGVARRWAKKCVEKSSATPMMDEPNASESPCTKPNSP
jgi:hypothetical protein